MEPRRRMRSNDPIESPNETFSTDSALYSFGEDVSTKPFQHRDLTLVISGITSPNVQHDDNHPTSVSRLSNLSQFLQHSERRDVLGMGSFGIVRQGWDTIKKKYFALKVIRLYEESDKQKIMREVEILEKIHHPPDGKDWRQSFVLKSHDAWVVESTHPSYTAFREWASELWFGLHMRHPSSLLFIEMEFCEEGNLMGWLQDPEKNGDLAQGRRWFVQVAAGLSFLHEKNVIHRDLKPENILLTKFHNNLQEEGGHDVIAKIGDFGVSRLRLPEAHSQPTMRQGTPFYKAPEMDHPRKEKDGSFQNYTNKVDIYSLGIVLFFIHRPMQEGSNEELNQHFAIFNDFKDGVSFPKDFNERYEEQYEFMGLLLDMLWRDPDKRPGALQVVRKCEAMWDKILFKGFGDSDLRQKFELLLSSEKDAN